MGKWWIYGKGPLRENELSSTSSSVVQQAFQSCLYNLIPLL
jgi:hypothetical protein